MTFTPIDPKKSLASLEPEILAYWQKEQIFKRSIHNRFVQNAGTTKSENEFTFYDGPPFATGLPHYGHLLGGTIKDAIVRYQTMKGKYAKRRFGWDCHGLPIENLIEKEENITDFKQIAESIGVDTFCEMCRSAVQRYVKDWRITVERMGRFVDMDDDYKTMDPEFMESIWWAFSKLHEKGLIYEGHKPMHICPRCVTTLSNFEVTQGYSDRTDMSVVMTFPLAEDPKTVIIAWTTTPWSLPGNLWLLVGPNIEYCAVQRTNDEHTYICAKKLVPQLFKDQEYTIVRDVTAQELEGKKYEPLFPYFINTVIPSTTKKGTPQTYGERCFTILIDTENEVSDADGTGIVHITNSHGEDGFNISKKLDIDVLHHVNMNGSFKEEIDFLQGVKVKPEGTDPMSTDKLIIAKLKELNRYFSSYTFKHSYPHCWRCDTPLLNYATTSWFVAIEQIKDNMLCNKDQTTWVPSHLRDGRYGNWLTNARDWAISRNRFWGTPLPIWQSNDADAIVISSREDLMKHKPMRFTKITALRHGESQANQQNVLESFVPGSTLTTNGHTQATTAAAYISSKGTVNVIYCSPLARALETATIIANATGASVVVDERLTERNFDSQENTVITQNIYYDSESYANAYNTSDSQQEIKNRIQSFMDDTLDLHRSEHMVLVTHGSVLSAIEQYMTKEQIEKIQAKPYANYCVPTEYYYDHEHKTQMDLHKHRIDSIIWPNTNAAPVVEVTFMRHGETDYNLHEIVQGQSNPPLNDTGRAQVKATAATFTTETFDVILCSDLDRTKESAEIVKNTALAAVPMVVWPELRERSYGPFEGKSKEEFKPYRENFSLLNSVDGVEHTDEILKRAETVYKRLVNEYAHKKVLIVSHGSFYVYLKAITENTSIKAALTLLQNAEAVSMKLYPYFERIPEVLDCWFESGSMPFAKAHFPFNMGDSHLPMGFPADFIAEGIDQCRAWFYTLMALSTALFNKTPFENVIVNGIVLASDGKKMSKKLKNYPEPLEVVSKYGADAIRFTLMNSPAVRGEDLRISEQIIENSLKTVLLPLWNSYSFFITYANAAHFDPKIHTSVSAHPLDVWIVAEIQDLINRMTEQYDHYDLSASCSELFSTIDAITNWYIRLSRRRFAGKTGQDDTEETLNPLEALSTLYSVLVKLAQVLSPICPFIADYMYQNLVQIEHNSVHLSDWPTVTELSSIEVNLLQKNRLLRLIVSLGLSVRGEAVIKNRQPLALAQIAFPPHITNSITLVKEDIELLQQELNVKRIEILSDPSTLASITVIVDARKVGPRLGKRVQEVIAAGKNGDFTKDAAGNFIILGETISSDEAVLRYIGKESANIAAQDGVVVQIDTHLTDELIQEGLARDLIRTIQRLRKESGYSFTQLVPVEITGLDAVLQIYSALITSETKTVFTTGLTNGIQVQIDETEVTIALGTAIE